MINLHEIIWVILITLAVFGILWVIIRMLVERNNVVKLKESEIDWEEFDCPKCQTPMQPGYSMAGRGVIWKELGAKKPGLFSTIGSVLGNTMSINAPPALNISWRCDNCHLLVLDNSKMVQVKNA